jgi:acyl-CoA reductase-like NAD-dependent aldehyde dehydrogenase
LFSIFFFDRARNHDFMPRKPARLTVQKTYKLFIGGKFVRGENGRVILAKDANGKTPTNYCRASRKDFRDAVTAARNALSAWSNNSAYLRGQILYRAAEMMETRRPALEEQLSRAGRTTSRREVTASIDRLVYYAGWTDKFAQIVGSVNPVASSHFNFTIPEPTGVVVAVCPDQPSLLGLVSILAPIVAGGNCVIAIASTTNALPALTFSEIIATSDFPGGVINILAGDRAELAPHFARHMDVNAIVDGSGDEKIRAELQSGTAINVKRYHRRRDVDYFKTEAENPYWIVDTTEMKTAWHPIGL